MPGGVARRPRALAAGVVLIAILVLQVLLSLLLGHHLADQLNPDAVAYGRMAQLWTAGRPDLALNATWGVLSTWLAVPPLLMGVDPVDALRWTQVLCGLVVTIGTDALLGCLVVVPPLRNALVLAAALHGVYASTVVLASDPAYVAVFVWLCWALLTPRDRLLGVPRPLVAGMLAALAYLARPTGLPMGLAMLAGTELIRAASERVPAARLRRRLGWDAAGWMLIALPWMFVLGMHYGHVTLTHSAQLVRAAVGPHGGHPWNLPSFTRLHLPPDGRVTTWEDPSLVAHDELDWSPFESPRAWVHQRRLVQSNLGSIAAALLAIDGDGLAIVALLGVAILGIVRPRARVGWREPWLLLAPTLHVLALAPLYVEQRYLWPVFPIALCALGALGTRLLDAAAGAHPTPRVLAVVGCGVLVVPPVLLHATMAAAFMRVPARSERMLADRWAARVRAAGAVGPVASWSAWPEKALDPEGLYLAWRLGQPWLANLATDGHDVQRAAMLGARVLVVKIQPGDRAQPSWLGSWSVLAVDDVRGETLRDGRYLLLAR